MNYKFSVDESIRIESQEELIKGAKLLVQLAQIAQSALDSIERTGTYEGAVPTAVVSNRNGFTQYYLLVRNLRDVIPPDESQFPSFKDFTYSVKEEFNWKGDKRYTLKVNGTFFDGSVLTPIHPGKWVNATINLGFIKVNAKSLSFKLDCIFEGKRFFSIPFKKEYKGKKGEEAILIASKAFAFEFVRRSVTAYSDLIRPVIVKYLVENDITRNILREFYDLVTVQMVMSS